MATHPAPSSFGRAICRGYAVLVLLPLTGCRGGDVVAPTVGLSLGDLIGSAISLPAHAGIKHRTAMPHSLVLSVNSSDNMVRVAVEYTGPGTSSAYA